MAFKRAPRAARRPVRGIVALAAAALVAVFFGLPAAFVGGARLGHRTTEPARTRVATFAVVTGKKSDSKPTGKAWVNRAGSVAIEVDWGQGETVADLKVAIEAVTQVPAAKQSLRSGGEALGSHSRPLAECAPKGEPLQVWLFDERTDEEREAAQVKSRAQKAWEADMPDTEVDANKLLVGIVGVAGVAITGLGLLTQELDLDIPLPF
mmetsp:Transcript_81604/g.214220  ORF Transcript_81604/g.214220 Transcript_81604/m.214220 type:complete len:208 (-) Transcript_81604:111-734(-)